MIRAHANAVLALLRAAPGSKPLVVFDGSAPQLAEPPYVAVYFASSNPEWAESRSLTGDSERHVVRAYVHCAGATADAARAVADRVQRALLDVAPSIEGRTCWPIRHESGQPAESDESTGVLVVSVAEVYRLESAPA